LIIRLVCPSYLRNKKIIFMGFMCKAGYTPWDHRRNEDILTELQISQITEFIYRYRKNWKEHVESIPKMILKCCDILGLDGVSIVT
jgi:hypothetical protein